MQDGLHSWLLDKSGRDQFVIRYGDETAVFWNDSRRARGEEVYKRGFWTETFVQVWCGVGVFGGDGGRGRVAGGGRRFVCGSMPASARRRRQWV